MCRSSSISRLRYWRGGHSNTSLNASSSGASQAGKEQHPNHQKSIGSSALITPTEPILVCSSGQENYSIYLDIKKDTEINGDSGKDITLRIIDTNNNDVIYGLDTISEVKWNNWELIFVQENYATLVPLNSQSGKTTICSRNNKVRMWNKSANQGKIFWKVQGGTKQDGTQFKINCPTGENKKECDIEFKDQSPFTWNNGYKPKISLSQVTEPKTL